MSFLFYCPAQVYLFEGLKESELFDEGVFDTGDPWDQALVEHPEQHLPLLSRSLLEYNGGILGLEPSEDAGTQDLEPLQVQTTLVAGGGRLWLEVRYPADGDLTGPELERMKRFVADSIETQQDMVSQWGWIDTTAGALLIGFQPVENYSFSCFQPQYADLLEDHHILTHAEWLEQIANGPAPGQSFLHQLS